MTDYILRYTGETKEDDSVTTNQADDHRWKSGAVISFAWGCANCATLRRRGRGGGERQRQRHWKGEKGTRRPNHRATERTRRAVTRRREKRNKKRRNEKGRENREHRRRILSGCHSLRRLYCIFRLLLPFLSVARPL